MSASLATSGLVRRHLAAVLLSVCSVAIVTAAVFGARQFAPVISLGVLYLFAVLPVAVLFGALYAVPVSLASMLAFNFFFLPPVHTLALRNSENWFALAVYLVTALLVSELATRSRRRAGEAERRQREATFLAEVSATLLEAEDVQGPLREISARAAELLGTPRVRIEVGSLRRPERGERAYDLDVGRRHVGRLFTGDDSLDAGALERLLAPLASLLGVADDRARLSRAALEAQTLRRSDAVKTAILRAVSHDLRSPLTAIRAAGEGLDRHDLDLDEHDRGELLATIKSESARLERLVANLIDLSRLEAGAAEPRPELLTADDLVARALDTLGEASDRIAVLLPAEPVATLVDGAQIERVLVNVIENALKFSGRDDPIELTVEDGPAEIAIQVRDHGPGLAPGELERVFEPFERGQSGSSREGSGLGLAIAKGFAQANGGRLAVASAPGSGALFTLTLPRAAALPAKVPA